MARRRRAPGAHEQPVGFYDDPEVFDILHARGTSGEVAALERIERRFVRTPARGRTWLEPACGTGRYLRAAAARGKRTVGFDISPVMVDYARRRSVGMRARIALFIADLVGFRARGPASLRGGRVDLAFNLINTIRHVRTDAELVRHLSQVRRCLRPGGVYVVGLSMTAFGLEFPSEDVWEGRRGRCRVKQVVEYVPPTRRGDRDERVYSHLVISRGRSAVEHRDSVYRLRCYSVHQWFRAVSRAGMRVIGLVDDRGRDMPLPKVGYAVFVLAGPEHPLITRSRPTG